MASKLTERDKNVLDANLIDIVGNKPYENGKWGTKNEDFVYLEIYDVNDNLIQYENLPVSQFILNSENDNVEFYPGSNIRSLGFESGTFKLKYNFLRKLAGDESAVLVHTVDKNNTKIGDIYTNQNKLHITEDGIVFAATEQEYKDSPTTAEQLAVEDLKYQIHEISPSRTEVRLRAKQINGTYIDDFVNIQTKNIYQSVDVKINFIGSDIYQTTTLAITPETNGFVFNQQMVNGTLTIPEVYKVDEIESAVRSGFNIVENGTFEILETDNMGNVTKLSEKYDWDSELHEDAVRAVGWHHKGGYRGHGGVFNDTEHIGYHAKIVQREGIANGNALKFTDNNAMFESVPGWPAGNFYRSMLLRNDNVPTLSSLGVKAGDFINVRMDIKSTVPGKGARALFSYPDEIITEEQPTRPPTGYFNPESSGPTEPMPSSRPPGYQPNSTATASAIESKPGEMESQIIQQYDLQTIGFKKVGRPGTAPKDVEIGDTTANTTIAGAGAWKIINMFDDGNPEDGPSLVHTWGPNLEENLQIGVLSSGEEWTWNGSLWVASTANTDVPTPPENTVNNINAVNHHPYVVKGGEENYTGKSYYPRKRRPGQNRGWQTGTFLYDNQSDNNQLFDNTTDSSNGSTTTLLFKDDLVWGTEFGSESSDTLMLWEFDDLFPDVREVIVDSTTNKTLYDDIFEKGFIQSVTNVNEGTGGTFVVFYNNGDTLENGTAHPDSNRFFQMRHNNNYEVGPEKDGKKVHLLSEINELLNQEVLESTTKLEVAFSSWTRSFGNSHGGPTGPGFWFFTEDNVHWAYKTTFNDIFGVNMNLTTTYDEDGAKFKGLRRGYFPDVMIGHGPPITEAPQEHHDGKENYFLAYSRSDATKLYRTVGTSGANYYEDINDIFFNVGVLGTRGAPLTYGVRNPAAENFGRFGGEQGDGERLGTAFTSPFIGLTVASNDDEWKHIVYHKSEKAIYDFTIDPLMIGTQSSLRLWTWDGYEWVDSAQTPPRYSKTQGNGFVMAPTEAGKWETIETSWEVPFDWKLDQDWVFYIQGNNMKLEGYEPSQGIVWVDNVFVDFTYTDQSETREVLKPYKAQINSISSDGLSIQVNKSFRDVAIEVGQDDVDLSTPDIYDLPVLPDYFNNFYVTYFNLNPKDLRTYLKFDNQMVLTTNFKQDLISVTDYPNSVVYKLYEPLPTGFEIFDECTVVKEMANPLEEIINVVDFRPEEEPKFIKFS